MQLVAARPILALAAAVGAAAAGAVVLAPTAGADCNTVTSSTLCASGGTVKGSSGAPTSVPTYNPFPCSGNPACDYYDDYNPGLIFDLSPNWGNRPQPR